MGRDVKVCTLVKRGTAFIEHELVLHEESDIDHVLIEVVPSSGRKKTGLFVLNLGLTVLNEPASHTRIGQGVCRDTSPDLSVWSGADAVTWSNSFEDLGSDHRILCVTVGENESEEDVCRKARIVDWDRFRKNRERDKKEGPIEDISEWCRELLADVAKATDEIEWTDWRQESPKEVGDRCRGAGDDDAPQPTATRTEMAKLRHKYKDDPEAFVEEIVQTHLTRPEGKSHPEYCGDPNEELDADFSLDVNAVFASAGNTPKKHPWSMGNTLGMPPAKKKCGIAA
ncbi:hypothetical protein HPB49_002524 [Dermacentor silvarum]|uniref:Uncharacterized protein n=1 Tax=Dermacentor silvarum TaxID=543639 RepID=A0ACB8CD47_DERSI|nr:hypothetical protein HPB49_002524 [Dermacentor silvarum]